MYVSVQKPIQAEQELQQTTIRFIRIRRTEAGLKIAVMRIQNQIRMCLEIIRSIARSNK